MVLTDYMVQTNLIKSNASIHVVHEDVKLIQTPERRLDLIPKGKDQGHRRVALLTAGEAFHVTFDGRRIDAPHAVGADVDDQGGLLVVEDDGADIFSRLKTKRKIHLNFSRDRI